MTGAPILICYDGSDDARRAIEVAATLLSPRHAIVVDIGPILTAAESVAAVGSIVPGRAFEDLNKDDALKRAHDGAELAEKAGFSADARADLSPTTWQGIVDVADEVDAAVIVIGSRGLNGVQELVEGSVSHGVAEHAGRPVLVVPPPHEP
jgi:nucleotide-binding universal stress UspA family protein